MVDHGAMKAYSEDLRQKVVQAVQERGISKSDAARLFSMSLSSIKRYTRLADRGESLTPKKGGGRPPIADETTRKRLEEDIRTRPSATVRERRHFLESFAGKTLSEPTLRRLLKRMGFSRKKDCGSAGMRRMAKSGLEGDASPIARCSLCGVRGRDGNEHLAFSSLCVV
jgi:transposase